MTSAKSPSAASPSPVSPSSRQPVHSHFAEGFGTVTVTPVDPAADAGLIHGWVTQERARFWGMGGASRELVREIYEDVDRRTTHHAFIVALEGVPAGLFQTYECEADRVSECYDVQPGDVGLHLLIAPGEGAPRPGFSAALLTAFLAFVFSDPAARRLVAEPDARNAKAIARLERTGFVLGPEVVLPEIDLPEIYLPAKPARLAFLGAPAAPSAGSR